MRYILICFLLINTTGIYADKFNEPLAEFSGEGVVKTAADFITVTLAVNSQCYPSPSDAQTATDEVVKKIDDYLQTIKKVDDERFKILIDGGYTTAYSRWHKERELCRNTYQKTTNITLKTSVDKDFDKVFSAMQTFVLKQFDQGPLMEDWEQPKTYVSLGTPEPDIDDEHRLILERKALDLALRNAKANFVAALSSCEPHRWKIHKISEDTGISYPQAQPRFYAAGVAKEASAAVVPIRFDQIEINKTLKVGFQFDGSLCFEANSPK